MFQKLASLFNIHHKNYSQSANFFSPNMAKIRGQAKQKRRYGFEQFFFFCFKYFEKM